MPYTLEAEREAVRKQALRAINNPGDLTFLFTCAMLNAYIAQPNFLTLHSIKKLYIVEPKHCSLIQTIRTQLSHLFTVGDIQACVEMAYDEFSRRVVAAHEKKKIELNGDMKEFQSALKIIEELGKPVIADEVKPNA